MNTDPMQIEFRNPALIYGTFPCHNSICNFFILFSSYEEKLRDAALLDPRGGGGPGGAALSPAQGRPGARRHRLAPQRRPHPAQPGHQLHHQRHRSLHPHGGSQPFRVDSGSFKVFCIVSDLH